MQDNCPKILLTLTIGGENGGPYTSHRRIIESELSEKYNLIPLMIPNVRRLRKPKTFFSVVKKIKAERPDFVQITGLQLEGFFMMLACKFAKVKTVVAVHGSSLDAMELSKFKKFILNRLEKYTIRNATKIYGVSDFVSSWDRLAKKTNYFGTIYNLPEEYKEVKESKDIRSELGISKEDIVVVSTGRIIKDKGYDVFWDVIQKTKSDKIKYVIAGDGAYRKEWGEAIISKGYQNRVFLLGFRKDIDDILSGGDIFMICSKHETLCISVLEAAMHSLPVVATNTGGIPEIVGEDGGFLIENGNVDEFAKAIRILADSVDLRMTMGNRLNQRVLKKFDRQNILSRLDLLYQQVLYAKR